MLNSFFFDFSSNLVWLNAFLTSISVSFILKICAKVFSMNYLPPIRVNIWPFMDLNHVIPHFFRPHNQTRNTHIYSDLQTSIQIYKSSKFVLRLDIWKYNWFSYRGRKCVRVFDTLRASFQELTTSRFLEKSILIIFDCKESFERLQNILFVF